MDTLCEQSLETTDSSTETAIETGSHCTGVGHKFSFTEKNQNNFPKTPQLKQGSYSNKRSLGDETDAMPSSY